MYWKRIGKIFRFIFICLGLVFLAPIKTTMATCLEALVDISSYSRQLHRDKTIGPYSKHEVYEIYQTLKKHHLEGSEYLEALTIGLKALPSKIERGRLERFLLLLGSSFKKKRIKIKILKDIYYLHPDSDFLALSFKEKIDYYLFHWFDELGLSYRSIKTEMSLKKKSMRFYQEFKSYFKGRIFPSDIMAPNLYSKFHRIEKNIADKIDNKFKEFQIQEIKKIEVEEGRKWHDLSPFEKQRISREINAKVKLKTKKFENKYREIVWSCHDRHWNPARKNSAKWYLYFTQTMSVMATSGAYFYNQWDQPKDLEFFSKLGYELSFGFLSGLITAKIVSNPNLSFAKMSGIKYFARSGMGLVDVLIYPALFGTSSAVYLSELEEILASEGPMKEKKLDELKAALEREKWYPKFKRKLFFNLKTLFNGKLPDGKTPRKFKNINDIDFDNLTLRDLEDPDNQDLIIAALRADEYEKSSGELIRTGDTGLDRWVHGNAFGAISLAKSMGVSLYMYRLMCFGQLEIFKSMAQAAVIFTIDRIVTEFLYYYSRDWAINN